MKNKTNKQLLQIIKGAVILGDYNQEQEARKELNKRGYSTKNFNLIKITEEVKT